MKFLTFDRLVDVVDRCSHGQAPFEELRSFVYQYYEAEQEIVLDEPLGELFPVLAPYLEYEEAVGDPLREQRIHRLHGVLSIGSGPALVERAVFALNFREILELAGKYKEKVIDTKTFHAQLKKLSPANIDACRLSVWAAAHLTETVVIIDKLV